MGMSSQDKNRVFGRIGLSIGLIGFIAGGIVVPVGILHHKKIISWPVSVLFFLVLTGVAIYWYWKTYNDPAMTGRAENEDLLETGVPGIARVLEKSDTGWTVNTQPRVELQLEVQLALPDCPAYKTKIKTLIPRLQPDRYNPGAVLEVRVDPKKFLKRIYIVGAASDGQEDEGPDQRSSRPKRSRKKSTARGRKGTPHEQQQEEQA